MKHWFLSFCLLLCACGQSPTYHAIDGKRYAQRDFRGHWVLINYWASWCHSCATEIPQFNALYQQHKAIVIGINFDASERDQLAKQSKKFAITYPVLLEDAGKDYGFQGIRGLPTTLVINPQGKLVDVLLGEQTLESLLKAIKDA